MISSRIKLLLLLFQEVFNNVIRNNIVSQKAIGYIFNFTFQLINNITNE
jgi:hypothetical protein